MNNTFRIPLSDPPAAVDAAALAEAPDFEKAWAAYLGVAHAVGFTNSVQAYESLFKAIPLAPGARILMSACSTAALWEAVQAYGLEPVLLDADPYTLQLDHSSLDQALWGSIDAVAVTHLFGRPAALESLVSAARKFGAFVIEDALHAPGAEYRGRKVGSLGDAGVFCFRAGRILGDAGDGGAVVTNNAELAATLAAHGRRMDTQAAARLSVRLAGLELHLQRREALADAYRTHLGDLEGVRASLPERQGRHVYYRFVIRVIDAALVRARLAAAGIEAGQPVFHALRGTHTLPVARAASREILYLPMPVSVGEPAAIAVCDVLRSSVPPVTLIAREPD